MIHPENIDLLIVEDDEDYRKTVVRWFLRRGYRVQDARTAEEAVDRCQRQQFHVGVFDLRMPGQSGLELLQQIKASSPETEVILLTGEGTIETAVEAMKLGALDYLLKPFPLAELEVVVQRAAETCTLRKENRQLKALLQRSQGRLDMIGNSPSMQEVFRLIERAGPTDKAILIQGESGTGKELVAQALQKVSLRADQPFVVINCAALPENLLESELFGHERGAFTGAVTEKQGLFEVADGGTLFIDEIGELAGSLQAKLLRVLQDGSLRRVGSLKERRVNVRILAATNRKLNDEVKAGRFREDLYYRINVLSLELPPLRQRADDVVLLVDHFLGTDWKIEPDALRAMRKYPWPGNVRQLINAIDRAKILADDHLIRLDDLPHDVADSFSAPSGDTTHRSEDDLASIERAHVLEILKRERGNKSCAARALGVNRRSLYRLLEKYNIDPSNLT
ncbi:MAG: two component, sigma54 specific, transcriptional regulator, Fis family [Planctomycetaceae bacterium]|nr:two component, sigma54 specific, transcriptional regulator, Fis family [Planctomycetaceae bacterium]